MTAYSGKVESVLAFLLVKIQSDMVRDTDLDGMGQSVKWKSTLKGSLFNTFLFQEAVVCFVVVSLMSLAATTKQLLRCNVTWWILWRFHVKCVCLSGCSIFENCRRCNNGTWGPRDDFFINGQYCAECRPGWSGGDCMSESFYFPVLHLGQLCHLGRLPWAPEGFPQGAEWQVCVYHWKSHKIT